MHAYAARMGLLLSLCALLLALSPGVGRTQVFTDPFVSIAMTDGANSGDVELLAVRESGQMRVAYTFDFLRLEDTDPALRLRLGRTGQSLLPDPRLFSQIEVNASLNGTFVLDPDGRILALQIVNEGSAPASPAIAFNENGRLSTVPADEKIVSYCQGDSWYALTDRGGVIAFYTSTLGEVLGELFLGYFESDPVKAEEESLGKLKGKFRDN